MRRVIFKVLAAITYLAMVAINFLAVSLPLNNRSTGEISDAYPNLFTPAGFTFSIWGLIYLFLAAYVFFQFWPTSTDRLQRKEELLEKVNTFFVPTSIANVFWVFAWHYDFIGPSVLIMLVLLTLLIKIADVLRIEQMTLPEKLLILTPFSLYFGWITVATIANITVFLVSAGWKGFGLADSVWTSIILVAGALIGVCRMHKDKSLPYGLVLIWAYSGILYKHWTASGYGGKYPGVIVTAILCLALFLFFVFREFYPGRVRSIQTGGGYRT